jgi:hypothetical protein
MSIQKVLGLRTQPPCKFVWCLQDGWVMFSRLDSVAVFCSITEVFCLSGKDNYSVQRNHTFVILLQMSFMEQNTKCRFMLGIAQCYTEP